MTREQTIKLLEVVKGCYPNTKAIESPRMMVEGWMLAFSNEKAEDVYRAVRYHMTHNKYFPTIADITSCMNRAKIIYDKTEAIASEITPQLPSGDNNEMSMEELWEWIVEDHKKGLYKVEQ